MSAEQASNKPSFSEFSPSSHDQWKAAAEKLLKGAPFDKKMITRTYEGIDLQPIYSAETTKLWGDAGVPGASPFRRGTKADGSGRRASSSQLGPETAKTHGAGGAGRDRGPQSLWSAGSGPACGKPRASGGRTGYGRHLLDCGGRNQHAARGSSH